MNERFSAEFLQDPTRATHITEDYEAQILTLFEQFKGQLTRDFEHADRQSPTFLQDFYARLDRLIQDSLTDPARKVIEKQVPRAYQQGLRFADLNINQLAVHRQESVLDRRVGLLIYTHISAFRGITDETSKHIRTIIADGILSDAKFGDVSREIVRQVDDVGIVRASTMVRTETMRAVNTGAADRYEARGFEELERLEASDELTCTDWPFEVGDRTYHGCVEINGEVFTLEEAREIDAQTHPNCRGTWVPAVTRKEKAAIVREMEEDIKDIQVRTRMGGD